MTSHAATKDIPQSLPRVSGHDREWLAACRGEGRTFSDFEVGGKLTEIGRSIDMVNVFRRPNDIPPHVEDILAAKPKYVWFQLGIRNDAVAEQLAKAGIRVIQDRCLMVEEGRARH